MDSKPSTEKHCWEVDTKSYSKPTHEDTIITENGKGGDPTLDKHNI